MEQVLEVRAVDVDTAAVRIDVVLEGHVAENEHHASILATRPVTLYI